MLRTGLATALNINYMDVKVCSYACFPVGLFMLKCKQDLDCGNNSDLNLFDLLIHQDEDKQEHSIHKHETHR